jgi:hypothetical protein
LGDILSLNHDGADPLNTSSLSHSAADGVSNYIFGGYPVFQIAVLPRYSLMIVGDISEEPHERVRDYVKKRSNSQASILSIAMILLIAAAVRFHILPRS